MGGDNSDKQHYVDCGSTKASQSYQIPHPAQDIHIDPQVKSDRTSNHTRDLREQRPQRTKIPQKCFTDTQRLPFLLIRRPSELVITGFERSKRIDA